jgi:ABC-type nitrate/sulfonate/bicarbonate transport system ATPase subunit
LKRLHTEQPLTTLHVTHQRREATRLATRLFVMDGHQVREQSLDSLLVREG